MSALDDISVAEYLALSEPMRRPYEAVLKHLKPVNKLAGGEINRTTITYTRVKKCLKLLQTGKTKKDLEALYCLAFEISSEAFLLASVSEFFAAQNYVLNFFVNLQKREAALLASVDMDASLWEASGGEKLNKFGNLSPLAQLGGLYGVWPFDLENKPYLEILTLLTYHKTLGEVQKEYSNLKQKLEGGRHR